MRTHLREPDTLTLAIVRHPFRGETSLEMLHTQGGMVVVLWDDWAPCPEMQLHAVVETAVRLWVEKGPLAAGAYMDGLKGRRRP